MNKTCTIPAGITAKVWFGAAQTKWVSKTGMSGSFTCSADVLGEPDAKTYKRCFYVNQALLQPVLDPKGQNLMPAYDPALIPATNVGEGVLKVRAVAIPTSRRSDPYAGGEFRIGCDYAKMAPDDPIVYPSVPGASHLHTFFGNVDASAYSTNDTLRASGNSTCAGGIANRSGYWIPSVINTANGQPMRPIDTVTYYKSVGWKDAEYMTAPPKGLRMIAGNSKPLSIADSSAYMLCQDQTKVGEAPNYGVIWQGNHLQACGGPNQRLRISVDFPSCWDGKNLDSPDHQSHMAKNCKDECEDASGNVVATANGCPASHPIAIPKVTINADYANLDINATYRLSSDNYSSAYPGGYSSHGDWMNGWDEAIMKRIVDNCMKKHMDCGGPNLGDGQELFGFYND
ncbi:MAG: DUF1996 domain-containing protein [Methylophilus sp.]|nr:DUF1996 domain-containing protein [Methylophilus sp.]